MAETEHMISDHVLYLMERGYHSILDTGIWMWITIQIILSLPVHEGSLFVSLYNPYRHVIHTNRFWT
jgi:hypothetical protein